MIRVNRLNAGNSDFSKRLALILDIKQETQHSVRQEVLSIIDEISKRGDEALLELTQKFDQNPAKSVAELKVSSEEMKNAWDSLDQKLRHALSVAHKNITEYAEMQKIQPFSYKRADGSDLAQKITPLDSVGIYVPGGKAAYPSTVLMNAIPAKVAGVEKIIMVSPATEGKINPLILAAAHLCRIDTVYKIGGAQAVAALAYGTESIEAVNKITGPGNQFVAEAKRQVFGKVGIDMIAGPSEVVIIADSDANPEWIVADLFAQAEHDEMAQSILITPSQTLIDSVDEVMNLTIDKQPRSRIITNSLNNRGIFILTKDIEQCAEISNFIAPEHLEIIVKDGGNLLLNKIRHAGAIFLGANSNEVFGDYCAGTNHILPTSGTARFSSGLGVYDFQKRTSILRLSEQASQALSPIAECLATGEGLFAHALSAQLRGNHY